MEMKKFLLASVAMCCALSPQAQDSNPMDEFNKFRQGIMDEFQEFRHTILEHYADFLEGTWHEYEPLEPKSRYHEPKPIKVPDIAAFAPSQKPIELPEPVLGTIPVADPTLPSLAGLASGGDSSLATSATVGGAATIAANQKTPKIGDRGGNGSISTGAGTVGAPDKIAANQNLPKIGDRGGNGSLATGATVNGPSSLASPFAPPKCEIPAEAKREIPLTLGVKPDLGKPMLAKIENLPVLPVPAEEVAEAPAPAQPEAPAKPVQPEQPVQAPAGPVDVVKFYDMEIPVAKVDFRISNTLEKVSDFARHWKSLDEQEAADKIAEALNPAIKQLGLNDYLAMEFIEAYMDSKFPQAGLSPKMSAVHYTLANMGFNARLAVATRSGDPIILIPAEQQLYGITYLQLNGQNFYILGNRFADIKGQPLATCDLPKGAQSGKKFNMVVNGLNLPRKDRKFNVNHNGLTLTGTVNENLMPLVYRYPQMETGDYAKSVLDQDLRNDLIDQVKAQLGGREQLTATNDLLKFVQFGFDYATDDDFHGFEKPYFLEENFYYPKNDCEDRAIFYTYFLWNALNTENHLLAFPGHEAASVSVPGAQLRGTSYMHNGKRFYISDPTYQGASTGMCMGQFEATAPKIDLAYPD